ncbi:hypothetical protein DEIPH_ctg023orf0056 [Deinococcus phoenicis]|uniref:Uncharacterized protein n=1 Tax=Deinococcus phoenicis TaxID=1476583 RepID=A0A016QR36_9DEIO|nr:hypothetical protein [Deinococcus phoenicis]EYB68461.1 hypothetical protein DEIPH_ctg023orf0056 [Deinococcus phoenicis]
MKLVTPRVHGFIDYVACAAMLAAPSLLNLKGGARTASSLFVASYLGVSALTDYPPALRRLIPFPVHGRVELASVPALLLVAACQKGTRERAYFLGLAGTVLTVYTLTDWQADPDA